MIKRKLICQRNKMNNLTILEFSKSGSKHDYSIKTKNNLQSDSMQRILDKHHKVHHSIRCKCDMTKELYLSVKQFGKKFALARYPKSEPHQSYCLYFSEKDKYVDVDEKGTTYKSKIFDEPEDGTSSKSTAKRDTDEEARRYTFYNFCDDLIADACTYAFNKKNANSSELRNFNFNDFCWTYSKIMKQANVARYGNVIEFCKKNNDFNFEYGVITNDFISSLDPSTQKDKDIVNVKLNPIRYENTNGTQWKTDLTKSANIGFKRLRIASKLVKIFDNYINPPYFYTAIYKKGIIVRFHIVPIHFDMTNITFVESNYERNYAKSLYEDGIVFIKPLSNNELYSIKASNISSECVKPPHIIYHPDFLELVDNKLLITEVSGFKNKAYVDLLEKKMRYYDKLGDDYSYVKSKCVDGSLFHEEQLVVREGSEDTEEEEIEAWDGTIIIKSGKNEGVMWKDVSSGTIEWYVDNLTGQFKDNGIKELKRREESNVE